MRYAGFWIRAVALFIDLMVLIVITIVVIGPFAIIAGLMMGGKVPLDQARATLEVVGPVVAIVAAWIYGAVLESSRWQGTLGKYAVGMKVTDNQGARITFGRATVRHWAKWISTAVLLLGWLMAGVTSRKRALHDMLARTQVVRSKAAPAV